VRSLEEQPIVDELEMAEFISSELLKQGIVVSADDILKVFELEMEYYVKKGIAEIQK
jgi:hypothetical protein